MYTIVYTKNAAAAIPRLKAAKLDARARALIDLLRQDPYRNPPSFRQLRGDLQGALSRRVTVKHRLAYQVLEREKTVKILSLWTQYEL